MIYFLSRGLFSSSLVYFLSRLLAILQSLPARYKKQEEEKKKGKEKNKKFLFY